MIHPRLWVSATGRGERNRPAHSSPVNRGARAQAQAPAPATLRPGMTNLLDCCKTGAPVGRKTTLRLAIHYATRTDRLCCQLNSAVKRAISGENSIASL